MRKIQFRGRTEEGEWLYGDLRQRIGYWPAIIESYCTDEGKVGYREIAVEETTIGQYTGLKDKNGVEIYEGDVIESRGVRHLVEYCEQESCFVGVLPGRPKDKLGNDFTTDLRQYWIDKFGKEVIGNIHDNPELLNLKHKP